MDLESKVGSECNLHPAHPLLWSSLASLAATIAIRRFLPPTEMATDLECLEAAREEVVAERHYLVRFPQRYGSQGLIDSCESSLMWHEVVGRSIEQQQHRIVRVLTSRWYC